MNKDQLVSYIIGAIAAVQFKQTLASASSTPHYNMTPFQDLLQKAEEIANIIMTYNRGAQELATIYGEEDTACTGETYGVTTIVWELEKVWIEQPVIVSSRNFTNQLVRMAKVTDSVRTLSSEKFDKEEVKSKVGKFVDEADFPTILDIVNRYKLL